MTPRQEFLTLIGQAHHQIPTSMAEEDWAEEIYKATTVILNVTFPKYPWYRAQKDRILKDRGGFWPLAMDALGYVLAHSMDHPDDPWRAAELATKDLGAELKQYRNEPFHALPIDDARIVDDVVSPLLHDVDEPFTEIGVAILRIPNDQRGREILLDIAHGMSVRQAAFNNNISPRSAQERMAVVKKHARKEIAI